MSDETCFGGIEMEKRKKVFMVWQSGRVELHASFVSCGVELSVIDNTALEEWMLVYYR